MPHRKAVILGGASAIAIAALSLLTGAAFVPGETTSAMDTDHDVVLTFTPQTAEVPYGSYWSFELTSAENLGFIDLPGTGIVSTVSGGRDYEPSVYTSQVGGPLRASVNPNYAETPLDAGTYTVDVTAEGRYGDDYYHGRTATPATLTVTKAALEAQLRAVADPNNPDDVIATVVFTGEFADNFSPHPNAPRLPAGTWTIAIADADGTVAIERGFERSGDDGPATSFYWSDADPEVSYTISATFAPTTEGARNFEVAPADDFDYTSAATQRPRPTSTAVAAPPATDLAEPGFGLPLWAVVLTGAVLAALAALTIVFAVKARHTTTAPPTTGGVPTHAQTI